VRLALLALAWGSNFLWIELALAMLSPSWLTVARLALGTATLGAICAVRGYAFPRSAAVWGHLVVAGLLANVVPFFVFAIGQSLTNSAYAGILNGTTPLWTALALLAVTRAVPPRAQAAGLAVGFAGILAIFQPWAQDGPGSAVGVAACLAAAACYGMSFVYLARYVTPLPHNPIALATGQLATATVISVGLLPLDGGALGAPDAVAVGAVLVLGVVGTGLSYVLNYALLAAAGPTTTSSVAYLIPVVAAGLGVVVLGDHLPALAGVGAALVLAGVALVRRRPRSEPAR
jgi:drug/metabolite transporter (DMT)-like permease